MRLTKAQHPSEKTCYLLYYLQTGNSKDNMVTFRLLQGLAASGITMKTMYALPPYNGQYFFHCLVFDRVTQRSCASLCSYAKV